MLFEKIQYMIEDSMKKINTTRNTDIDKLKEELLYDQIISNLKKLYPIKLKGTHLLLNAQDLRMKSSKNNFENRRFKR